MNYPDKVVSIHPYFNVRAPMAPMNPVWFILEAGK
jgi:hypothetical protein